MIVAVCGGTADLGVQPRAALKPSDSRCVTKSRILQVTLVSRRRG
jgi:hypothetical protein